MDWYCDHSFRHLSPDSTIHAPLFAFGFAFGFFTIYILPFVKRKLSYGKASPLQRKMSNFAFILMSILVILCINIIGNSDPRTLWICIFLAVGVHVLPFIPVHGNSMLFLSLLTILIGVVSLILPTVPFFWMAIADAIIKITFGIFLLLKPTVIENPVAA